MTESASQSNPSDHSPPYSWHQSQWQQLLSQHNTGQMAHAYLVCGEQGIGKFGFVQAFAKYLFCLQATAMQACNQCAMCQLAESGSQPDILIIEPEDGSKAIKVDQIRALATFVARTSHTGKGKLVIINQADALNISAANSLLKTLEEPSNNTYLFLVTARADSLVATLRSRCQRLLLQTPSLPEAIQWLESHGIDSRQASSLAIAAGRRPLHGMEMANANSLADINEFLGCLLAVCEQRMPLQTAVAAGLNMGEELAIEYLAQTSSIVVKGLLLNNCNDDTLMADVVRYFAAASDKVSLLRRLLVFNRAAEQAIRQLRSGTNPNSQLVLESLLWQWSRLARGQSSAGA